MNRYFLPAMKAVAALVGLSLSACTVVEEQEVLIDADGHPQYYAQIEEASDLFVRTHADENLCVLWNADDRVSIFEKNTYNQQFRFDGQDGDNAGAFSIVQASGYITGNELPYVYSVYPYQASTTISNAGVLSVTLPSSQTYRADSFGPGDNVMVSVSDRNMLIYKNLGGYLMFKLYGEGISVSSLSLKGNHGELLSGRASVQIPLGEAPALEMVPDASGTSITLQCDPPVALGSSAENYTAFWFVVPPVTFSEGITLTVTESDGTVFEKETTGSITITRNKRSRMAPLEVAPGTVVDPSRVTYRARFADLVSTRVTMFDEYHLCWQPNDNFTLFLGTSAFASLRTEISEPSQTATFSGTVFGTPDTGTPVFAAYPAVSVRNNDPSLVYDGSYATMNLPALQSAPAGGFANQAMPCIARSTTDDLVFYPVGARIKFSVTQEGVQSVTFRGNGGEPLAGTFKAGFDTYDAPLVSEVTQPATILTLVPDGEQSFEVGQEYSFVLLPVQLSGGFTVELNKDNSQLVRSTTQSVSLGRAQTVSLGEVDKNATYSTLSVPDNEIWYKTNDGQAVILNESLSQAFGATLISNTYTRGQGVLHFDGPVTVIPERAFYPSSSQAQRLMEVHLPETVVTIFPYAFYGQRSLVGFYMPSSVTSVGEYAFANSGLRSVRLSPSLVKIGGYAFGYAELEEVYIPESVEFVNDRYETDDGEWYEEPAFKGNSLKRFSGKFASADGRCLIVRDTLKSFAYAGLTEYTLPAGIKCLTGYLSWGSITTLHFNNELETIGRSCFSWSRLQGNVILPPNLKWIGRRAFRYCNQMTSCYVPESLEYCGLRAFENTFALTQFTGHHISSDGRCLILNGELTAIALSGLTDYIIPSEATVIRNESFCNFSSNNSNDTLSSLEFHAGVTHIGNAGFNNCRNLTRIVMKPAVPPTLEGGLGYVSQIIVPAGSLQAYQEAPGWSSYAGIMQASNPGSSEGFEVEPWD